MKSPETEPHQKHVSEVQCSEIKKKVALFLLLLTLPCSLEGRGNAGKDDSAANSVGVHCPRLLTSVTEETEMSAFCVFCE